MAIIIYFRAGNVNDEEIDEIKSSVESEFDADEETEEDEVKQWSDNMDDLTRNIEEFEENGDWGEDGDWDNEGDDPHQFILETRMSIAAKALKQRLVGANEEIRIMNAVIYQSHIFFSAQNVYL